MANPHNPDTQRAISECDFYRTRGIWPPMEIINHRAWISQFPPKYAWLGARLLRGLVYYNDNYVRKLFLHAMDSAIQHILSSNGSLSPNQTFRESLIKNSIFCKVDGSRPSEADSSHLFFRYLRDDMGAPEENLMGDLSEALERVVGEKRLAVFVDDILGSGQQVSSTWNATRKNGESFDSAFTKHQIQAISVSIMATKDGISEVAASCNGLSVSPLHVLDSNESVTSKDCRLWKTGEFQDGINAIEDLRQTLGMTQGEMYGFNQMSLMVAFAHGTPDLTLGLYRVKTMNWSPLIEKGWRP